MLGLFADKTVPHPRESIEAILASEIGELQRRWTDNRSFLADFQEWAAKNKDQPTREEAVEKFVHDHMHGRLLARVGKARDVVIAVEVMFWEPPGPALCVKAKISEGDTVHPSAKFRTSLEFAPEPVPLNLAKIEPAPVQKPSPNKAVNLKQTHATKAKGK